MRRGNRAIAARVPTGTPLVRLSRHRIGIGNSGSGKSSLAEGLGALIHAPVFDLDLIHWKDDGFGAKQDEDMAWQKIADLAATQRWVIEGVYGGCRKSQFQEQRPLCGLDVLGCAGRGLLRVACVAAGPRPILQSSSDGQKLTGIARRRHP